MVDDVLAEGEMAARIRSVIPSLGDAERRVLQSILIRPGETVHWSVTELAGEVGVASSTVVRACQALGLKGFQELKILLSRDLGRRAESRTSVELTDSSGAGEILQSVVAQASSAVTAVASTVTAAQLEQAIAALVRAKHVLVAGVGTSAAPAKDIAYRLISIGRSVSSHSDPLHQHVAAQQLTSDDACLVVSYTGTTRETNQVAAAARAAGAAVVVVTSFVRSPLTEIADVALIGGGPENRLNMQSISSRLAHLTILDALYLGVALRDEEVTQRGLESTASVSAEHHL